METVLPVLQGDTHCYDIVLTDSLTFDSLGERIRALGFGERRVMIVSDTNTAPLYLQTVQEALCGYVRELYDVLIPAGEANKTLDEVKELYRTLILKGFDRGDLILALGGGVIGDMAGYAAATYLRGISFVQVPTSLLAMTDSSIGGKCGVDFDGFKNMVGAFHMPRLVYTNVSVLRTLDDTQFSCGMGEVIKHAFIRDTEFALKMAERSDDINARDPQMLIRMVRRSCAIKGEIVALDPFEKNERRLLNYGHTIGHAIEKASDFTLTHGACVSLGMCVAARIARNRGHIGADAEKKMTGMLRAFRLPVSLRDTGCRPDMFDKEKLLLLTRSDKKMDAGRIRFVLLKRIGDAYVDDTVTDDEMLGAMEDILFTTEGSIYD